MATEETENLLRDLVLRMLYERVGEPGSLTGEGKHARFHVKRAIGGGTFSAEGSLDYLLPSGVALSHKIDLLASLANGKHVAVELVCLSSVTDHFKARSYDMLHLKRAHGENLHGIMVYVHVPGAGISLKTARTICHPYDEFYGIETSDLSNIQSWLPPLCEKLEATIRAAQS